MDIREIRQMSDEDILDAIEDQKETLWKFRFQKASGALENPNALRDTRRVIAQLKTIQRERQLAEASAQGNKE